MKRIFLCALLATVAVASAAAADPKEAAKQPAWNMNATAIEACSCPMFCQCYFSTEPAGHSGHEGAAQEHYCRFTNAYKVNKGSFGATKLDGAKFWIAGDLGGDFSKGQMDWAVVTFDPSVTETQRTGIKQILSHVYPVKWNSFTQAPDATIDWTASKDHAEAKLNGGKD